MKQLSGLDAAFLYLESPRTPMHVGGVYLFNAANTQNFGFQAFRAHIASRLDSARTLRQRLVAVPLSLDHPYWAVDPDFVLDAHLSHQVLPRPRDWRALMTLAEGIFAQPLARERPLWAITFVEGLDRIEGLASGSFAMIVKVHHAAVDGVSGEEMIWALLDRQPRPDRRRRTKPCQPERLPSRAELLARAFAKTIMQPLQLAKLGGRLASAAVAVAKQKTLYHTPFPPLPLEAPFTRFNASVTAQRIFRAIQLPLSRVQAVRRLTEGATVNDVVLATCAGGLRRYLEVRQELPEKPLVALVPISLRPRRHWRDMGNRVSAMPVS
jgi:diacylglycerol O-acyltransferase